MAAKKAPVGSEPETSAQFGTYQGAIRHVGAAACARLAYRKRYGDAILRFTGKVKGSGLPPMRTLREMADEFGVTLGALQSAFMLHDNRPKPMRNERGNLVQSSQGGMHRYYNPAEVRAWWKSLPENK